METPLSAKAKASPAFRIERFVVADGTLEALKWIAMVLMALDHINKYLLGEAHTVLFILGRMAMPIFGFVLMYNLARPDALAADIHLRVMRRLLGFGLLATPIFAGLVGAWPLNIMFMLLLATGMVWLMERGGWWRVTAAVFAFIGFGALVEFWWFGALSCLGAWFFCRSPTGGRLALWVLALCSLWIVNRNFASLAALPLIWGLSRINIPLGRHKRLFYAFYPAHLALIWLAQRFV
ncbi:TraX family protein [Variovorax sp. MHTC-1]|uniref:TraX family protein n=1 Tax=Variovorax sp. MHTC-1 TaxID=2495593 RepID=UPI000F8691DB|nr:TraX family protein [Variovorax sp. MHTC-1]RST50022.1 conjugal transfer protein TraX [Variovorax sp. MHTC-1]